MPGMGMLRRLREKWRARRFELATKQLEAERAVPDLPSPKTDAISGEAYESARAQSGFFNPRAKTHTEWKGD